MGQDCQQTFNDLKDFLTQSPLLNFLKEGETLYLYLVVTTETTSSVMIRAEGGEQFSIYYTSQVSKGSKQNTHQWRSQLT